MRIFNKQLIMKHLTLSTIILLLSLNAFASNINKKKSFIPDLYSVQFAGNIGMFSISSGYNLNKNKIQTEFLAGYVPRKYSNSPITTLSWKTQFVIQSKIFNNRFSEQRTIGVAGNYSFTNNTHLTYPSYYPKDYYGPNCIRSLLYVTHGINYHLYNNKTIDKIRLYIELGSVDIYILESIKNDQIRFPKLNLAIGTTIVMKD